MGLRTCEAPSGQAEGSKDTTPHDAKYIASKKTIKAPQALRDLPGWLVWRRMPDPKRPDKPKKMPYYARSGVVRNGTQGSYEDRAQLVKFDEAIAAARRGDYDGVGLALMPEFGIVALDFDACVDGGHVLPEVERLVTGTYAEYSPSGSGVRAFMLGRLPNKKSPASGNSYGFETFHDKGFVTFTGNVLPLCAMLDCDDTLAELTSDVVALFNARFGRCDLMGNEPAASGKAPLGMSAEKIQKTLSWLDPGMGRDDWLRVGMGLHHETGGEGFELWDDWSADGANYSGHEETLAQWESFSRPRNGASVTFATVIRMANERGAGISVHEPASPDDFPLVECAAAPAVPSTISYIDFASLAVEPVPPRRWLVPQWIPIGAVTSLYGPGGVGKSLLAQQLSISVTNGIPWLGLPTMQGTVLALFCEDDADELKRRADSIFTSQVLDPRTAAEGLHVDARAGKLNNLVTISQSRLVAPAKLFKELREQCARLRPALVVLDNIAQLYPGAENDRPMVTAFCNLLTSLAIGHNCAVLLLGHPAKGEGSEYSGSTAWEAAVRTRLYLKRNDDGTSSLKKAKANYAALDELVLEYCLPGVFVAVRSDDKPEAVESAKAAILAAVKTYTARQQATSHVKTARNYVLKLMKEDALLEGVSEGVVKKALDELIDARVLTGNCELPWKNTSRHSVQGIAICGEQHAE